ncbi:uncharacterized protein METZ01_LOCUS158132 [marine metagenome]|uniref:Uncharacterized protein n=1 Tax=marine metagenome TaxID=408172 RepID=A0A382AV12_9ZZZZ
MPSLGNKTGTLLSNHHRGCIGVTRRDGWHHRRVNDPQATDPPDSQSIVYHSEFVVAHRTRPHRVENSGAYIPSSIQHIVIGCDLRSG